MLEMKKQESIKKHLQQLEYEEGLIPLLDYLYVVVSNRKHCSGYKCYNIYGIAYENGKVVYEKCITQYSDVIHIDRVNTYLRIDSMETNLFRLFLIGGYKFKITWTGSDFSFDIVKVNNND